MNEILIICPECKSAKAVFDGEQIYCPDCGKKFRLEKVSA